MRKLLIMGVLLALVLTVGGALFLPGVISNHRQASMQEALLKRCGGKAFETRYKLEFKKHYGSLTDVSKQRNAVCGDYGFTTKPTLRQEIAKHCPIKVVREFDASVQLALDNAIRDPAFLDLPYTGDEYRVALEACKTGKSLDSVLPLD